MTHEEAIGAIMTALEVEGWPAAEVIARNHDIKICPLCREPEELGGDHSSCLDAIHEACELCGLEYLENP